MFGAQHSELHQILVPIKYVASYITYLTNLQGGGELEHSTRY